MEFGLGLGMKSILATAMYFVLLCGFSQLPQLGTPEEAAVLKQGSQIAREISTTDWLGPLAPIALSPFFGMACLSGLATYGPEWLTQKSGLLADSSPLNNQALFWVMATLTLVTSLPRLSKVSKPIALAAEKLETYSVAIIYLSMRLFASPSSPVGTEVDVALAGLDPIHLPIDLLMALGAAINIVVINAIKLFIELLVWIIPFPFVDALLEATNKSVCLALIGLYSYSPLLATFVNLLLLSGCSLVFLKVTRRLRLYQHLIVGPVLGFLWPSRYGESDSRFVGFMDSSGLLPRYARVLVEKRKDGGWDLVYSSWIRSRTIHVDAVAPKVHRGLLKEGVSFSEADGKEIRLVRRRTIQSLKSSELVPET